MRLNLKKSAFSDKLKEMASEIESKEGRKVELIKRKILRPSPGGIANTGYLVLSACLVYPWSIIAPSLPSWLSCPPFSTCSMERSRTIYLVNSFLGHSLSFVKTRSGNTLVMRLAFMV